MKVVINARFLTQPISGVQRFAIELSKRLKKQIPNIQFVSPKNIYQTALAKELDVIVIGALKGHLWEQFDLPAYLKKNGSPLLINFTNTAPLFYRNKIVTIHDLAVYDFPAAYSFLFRTVYKVLLPTIAKTAKKVITVSEFSKSRITSEFKVIPVVIYNAVSDYFYSNEPAKKEKIILSVSSLDPKKNFHTLIKAFTAASLPEYQLILVGAKSHVFKSDKMADLIRNTPNIHFTGYITDDELVRLYRKSAIFIYPSLYEGFGIPPLEAMAAGTPTIVSDIPSLKEVCGDASIFFNPLDVNDLKEKIQTFGYFHDSKMYLTNKGLEQSKKYSWEASTEQLIQLIEEVR